MENKSKMKIKKVCKVHGLTDHYVWKSAEAIGVKPCCVKCKNIKVYNETKNRKAKAVEYLGGKCSKCGDVFHPAVFDFHHRNPDEKEFGPSVVLNRKRETIKKELDKCVLLCANCHAKEHYDNTDWSKLDRRRKSQIRSIKILKESHGGACAVCGEDWSSSLDFHHIKPETKKFGIGGKGNLANRIEESKKCMLLCKNCHRKFHAGVADFELRYTFNQKLLEESTKRNKVVSWAKEKEFVICKTCGVRFESRFKQGNKSFPSFCSRECCFSSKSRRKIKWPSKEELEQLLKENTQSAIGRKFGVTHSAVRKWKKVYGLK